MAILKTPNEIPFMLKLCEASQVLGIPVAEVRVLIRSNEVDSYRDPGGPPRIRTQSIIEFLGRIEFKRRRPSLIGKVTFS